jgi:hypothetical protein
MADWSKKLDAFLKFNEEVILHNNGKVSHEIACTLALKEYEIYKTVQDKNYISDFDKVIQELTVKTK